MRKDVKMTKRVSSVSFLEPPKVSLTSKIEQLLTGIQRRLSWLVFEVISRKATRKPTMLATLF